MNPPESQNKLVISIIAIVLISVLCVWLLLSFLGVFDRESTASVTVTFDTAAIAHALAADSTLSDTQMLSLVIALKGEFELTRTERFYPQQKYVTVTLAGIPEERKVYAVADVYAGEKHLFTGISHWQKVQKCGTTLSPMMQSAVVSVFFETNCDTVLAPAECEIGKTIAEPLPLEKTGFSFAGWYKDSHFTEEFAFVIPITANITLYANWQPNTAEQAPSAADAYPLPDYSAVKDSVVFYNEAPLAALAPATASPPQETAPTSESASVPAQTQNAATAAAAATSASGARGAKNSTTATPKPGSTSVPSQTQNAAATAAAATSASGARGAKNSTTATPKPGSASVPAQPQNAATTAAAATLTSGARGAKSSTAVTAKPGSTSVPAQAQNAATAAAAATSASGARGAKNSTTATPKPGSASVPAQTQNAATAAAATTSTSGARGAKNSTTATPKPGSTSVPSQTQNAATAAAAATSASGARGAKNSTTATPKPGSTSVPSQTQNAAKVAAAATSASGARCVVGAEHAYDVIMGLKQSATVVLQGAFAAADIGAPYAASDTHSVGAALRALSASNPSVRITLDMASVAELAEIPSRAFMGCKALTAITLPQALTAIGEQAFADCSSLTQLTVPASVTAIGNASFSGCSALSVLSVADGNASYYSQQNAIYQKEPHMLIAASGTISALKIPSGVTCIAPFACKDCELLTDISIPETVTSIGSRAFEKCSALESIRVPDSVTSLGILLFANCSALSRVELPSKLVKIEQLMFAGCSALSSITIPAAVNNISYMAFYGCTSLTSVTIPESVSAIGSRVFDGCTNLASVTFARTELWYASASSLAPTDWDSQTLLAVDVASPEANAASFASSWYNSYLYCK